MTGEQEQVLLIRQADQRGAHQRPLRQIERLSGRLTAQRVGLRGVTSQIVERKRQPVCRQNLHQWPIFPGDEPATQRFMTRIERIQTMLQRLPVQPAVQPQRQGDMVGFAHPFQLGQEPQALLGERQGQFAVARHRQYRQRFLSRRNFQRLRQHVQYRAGEQRLQR
ncbi:Uncharacterised protein [Serratia marcescens]|nr:Uncharacterised protein [Serratia marcescens]